MYKPHVHIDVVLYDPGLHIAFTRKITLPFALNLDVLNAELIQSITK